MSDFNPMDYACRQIYHEQTPIDVLFLGSSRIWLDVSSPSVNRYFDAHLHRPCQVLTLGWQRGGFDEAYFVFRDLVAHRKVHLVALYREWDQNPIWREEPHLFLYRACRYAEDQNELTGLPFKERMAIYGTSIFGAPRTLLSLFRPALRMDFASPHAWEVERKFGAFDPRENHGSLVAFNDWSGKKTDRWRPTVAPGPDKVALYSAVPEKFEFGDEISAYQRFFAAKIRTLAEAQHIRVVLLHLPNFGERTGALITEPANWPAIFGPHSDVVGIAPDDFWDGIPDADAARLVTDVAHLNANGQAIFTELISPALLHLYETSER
jgi:hypothetical protein